MSTSEERQIKIQDQLIRSLNQTIADQENLIKSQAELLAIKEEEIQHLLMYNEAMTKHADGLKELLDQILERLD